jgi:hypothetical protein
LGCLQLGSWGVVGIFCNPQKFVRVFQILEYNNDVEMLFSIFITKALKVEAAETITGPT